MGELARVKAGSEQAYLLKDRVVYEKGNWLRSKRQVLPLSKVSDVTLEERGSWLLFIAGVILGWQCAAGIVYIGLTENPEAWKIALTAAFGLSAAVLLGLFMLLDYGSVRVSSTKTEFTISGRTSTAELKDFARSVQDASAVPKEVPSARDGKEGAASERKEADEGRPRKAI